ncbi:MAG: Na+/H+ antiporter subunit E [Gammaproteobacteria bacterium]|jgi:multicomponent Na+:H+ antiporter subunit E|nr:Na+/H+ antiporter subunit E [Gammaproteobacteria bacterium]|tara:strand:+ start:59980 stop:60459 length:480 start_codon:yes stop_codon:yes gene_type:complete
MFIKFCLSTSLLFLVWLLLSGFLKTNLIVLGLLSSGLVSLLAVKLGLFSQNGQRLQINLRLPRYLPFLFKEIWQSNLHVAALILHPKLPIQPQTLRYQAHQKTDSGLAVHANSITLTPGTISVDINNNEILVHAISDTTAAGVKSGSIDKQVCKLEGKS